MTIHKGHIPGFYSLPPRTGGFEFDGMGHVRELRYPVAIAPDAGFTMDLPGGCKLRIEVKAPTFTVSTRRGF